MKGSGDRLKRRSPFNVVTKVSIIVLQIFFHLPCRKIIFRRFYLPVYLPLQTLNFSKKSRYKAIKRELFAFLLGCGGLRRGGGGFGFCFLGSDDFRHGKPCHFENVIQRGERLQHSRKERSCGSFAVL